MAKKQFIILVLFSFLGGIIGGTVSNKYFFETAYAKAKNSKIIDTNIIRILDDKGSIYCTLSSRGLEINDQKMLTRVSAFGLSTSLDIPDLHRPSRFTTEITPFGLGYRSYSAQEIKDIDKNPLRELAFDNNITIGASRSNSDEGITSIELYDTNKRLRFVVGGTELHNPTNDSTSKTSIASIVMFSDKGNVVWQAP